MPQTPNSLLRHCLEFFTLSHKSPVPSELMPSRRGPSQPDVVQGLRHWAHAGVGVGCGCVNVRRSSDGDRTIVNWNDSRLQATAAEIMALAERSDLTVVAARVRHALRYREGQSTVRRQKLLGLLYCSRACSLPYLASVHFFLIINILFHVLPVQAETSLLVCCLIESLRGATRAALSATQPAIFAITAPLLRPLLLLQKAFRGHGVVVALLLKLAAEMVRASPLILTLTSSTH